jgi:hypothetical protein
MHDTLVNNLKWEDLNKDDGLQARTRVFGVPPLTACAPGLLPAPGDPRLAVGR